MDAAQALTDLTEISAQIQAAVAASPDGAVVAATLPDAAAAALAGAGSGLLREAGERAVGVEARIGDASLFVVRDEGHVLSAVAAQGSASGLVLYDLRTCLRRLGEEPEPEQPAPRRRAPRAKKKVDEEA